MRYSLHFQIYSGLIDVSIHQLNETNGASSLLSDRAGVFLLAKDYPSNPFSIYPGVLLIYF